MVAGRRVGVLVASWAWCHLVVALGAGAGLVGALWRRGGIGGKLVCVIPAETRNKEGICWGWWQWGELGQELIRASPSRLTWLASLVSVGCTED